MEVIKKTVNRKMITGTTSGDTNTIIVMPDEDAVYFFKLLLTSDAHDMGFFDAVDEDND
ncbi:MAG: hypothetical protein ACOC2W_02770 [bacterium]